MLPGMENTLECFLQSIDAKSTKITRVIVAIRSDYPVKRREQRSRITVDYIPFQWNLPDPLYAEGYCHAIGLHAALKFVDTPYVMLTEPDIVFHLNDFDSKYIEIYEEHRLGIIGVSRVADPRGFKFFKLQSFGGFPTVINCLMRTDSLPPVDFLKGKLKLRPNVVPNHNADEAQYIQVDEKWLLQTPIPDQIDKFPNPKGVFPVGCNLYLWYKDKRWLSFHRNSANVCPPLCNATLFNINNFNLPQNALGEEPLLYHSGHTGLDLLYRCLQTTTGRQVKTPENLCSCAVCKS